MEELENKDIKVTFSYEDVPTLKRFAESPARVRGVRGVIGSGKSSACIWEIIRLGLEQAPSLLDGIRKTRWFIVRNTFRQLKDSTIRTVFEWLPEKYFGHYQRTDKNYEITSFKDTHIELCFRALDDEDDVGNLLSVEMTGAWINEAREVPKGIIDLIDSRIPRYPSMKEGGATRCGIIMDTNSPDEDSWWHETFEEGKVPEGWEQFVQPSALSPEAENTKNLAPGYYENMLSGKDADFVKVYLENQYGFVREGDPIFAATYVDHLHIAKEPMSFLKGFDLIIGMDFGLCYDDKTEVLTKDGWKFFKDVDEGSDLVATRNPINGNFEYTNINFKKCEYYEGKMIEWDSSNVNFNVTPEHRIPFTYRDTPDIVHFNSAQWLLDNIGGHHYVDLVSSWKGESGDRGYILDWSPGIFSEFMGYYLSEGSLENGTNRISITQYNKSNIRKIKKLLDKTGLCWHYGNGNFRTSSKELHDYLFKFGKCYDKYIPNEIKGMNPDLLKIFIDAYTLGDGHIRYRIGRGWEHTIATTSSRLAGELQEIAQKIGWNSSMRFEKPKESYKWDEDRVIKNNGIFIITFKKRVKRAELLNRNVRESFYRGYIYCLNVPYHTLYIRRNGKPSWNGNTPAAAFTQLSPMGHLNILDELVSEEMGVERFIKNKMKPLIANKYRDAKILIIGDPNAVKARSQVDERTCFQVLSQEGWYVRLASSNAPAARIDAINFFLTELKDYGTPSLQLNTSCKFIRKAFNAGYVKDKKGVPKKNKSSHIMEAVSYSALYYREMINRLGRAKQVVRKSPYSVPTVGGY